MDAYVCFAALVAAKNALECIPMSYSTKESPISEQ